MKEYLCPLCKIELSTQFGNYFHPNNPDYGLTLFCNNNLCNVEVFGYTRGKNLKDAFEIITDKYTDHIK